MNTVAGYRRPASGMHPPYAHPEYESTRRRAPAHEPIRIAPTRSELTGPRTWSGPVSAAEADLTHLDGAEAIGERIIVSGRVMDEDARPLADTLIEIWQANAAGRYAHEADQHGAPLDPHFSGVGRVVTDAAGAYRFMTVKPGAYPWRNHANAWRPAHIHYSLFGPALATRLITQMYFAGDPLLALDPIYNSVADVEARARLLATFTLELTQPEYALGYRFDFVLRGRDTTPPEGSR